jgi:hypothetical protein
LKEVLGISAELLPKPWLFPYPFSKMGLEKWRKWTHWHVGKYPDIASIEPKDGGGADSSERDRTAQSPSSFGSVPSNCHKPSSRATQLGKRNFSI